MITEVADKSELEANIKKAGATLVVIEFYAPWCGSCKMVAGKFEELVKENPKVVFLKVNADDQEDLALEYEVSGLPTFVIVKNGQIMGMFSGTKLTKVSEMIQKFQ